VNGDEAARLLLDIDDKIVESMECVATMERAGGVFDALRDARREITACLHQMERDERKSVS
jgi:hypothetical protein